MEKIPAVYILSNRPRGVLYVGVTGRLPARIWQHREGIGSQFTRRYQLKRLVYFELHCSMAAAITREKQLKAGSRKKKIVLIESINPGWRDLFDEIA